MVKTKQIHFDERVGDFHITIVCLPSGAVTIQTFDADRNHLISEVTTMPLVDDLVAAEVMSAKLLQPILPETIIEVVSKHYEITTTAIRGKKRKPKVSEARHTAMHLIKETTSMTLKEIAKVFGKKDHTAISYAIKKIKQRIGVDSDFAYRVNFLISKIKKDNLHG